MVQLMQQTKSGAEQVRVKYLLISTVTEKVHTHLPLFGCLVVVPKQLPSFHRPPERGPIHAAEMSGAPELVHWCSPAVTVNLN